MNPPPMARSRVRYNVIEPGEGLCRIACKALIPNLLCSRNAGSIDVSATALTALQFSDLTVTPMVTVLRTPARPNVSRPATCTHGVEYEEPDCAFCER